MDNNVQGLLDVSMERLKELVDANTVVGTPIQAAEGTVLIPVSKVSYGFAAGGSDFASKSGKTPFGGGSGAGVNVTPIGFLVIADGDVRMVHVSGKPDAADKLIDLVPDVIHKVSDIFSKKKDKKNTAAETAE